MTSSSSSLILPPGSFVIMATLFFPTLLKDLSFSLLTSGCSWYGELRSLLSLLAGEVARIGAGICSIALFTSTVFYVASMCGIVSMYYFYAPRASCFLSIFLITWTVFLLIVMMAMFLHSKFRKDEVKLEDDIRYNYGFFHIIFSLGAMYFVMSFISWNFENSASE
ncbi:hypothetical protein V6N11_050948 [Hibiscus sabdariffa]|uniref:Uncharacterized protein n=1 Tax=Hibiscus sabdariffa TaxID=183260 RepID=A0ABR2R2V2_9ROSI